MNLPATFFKAVRTSLLILSPYNTTHCIFETELTQLCYILEMNILLLLTPSFQQ